MTKRTHVSPLRLINSTSALTRASRRLCNVHSGIVDDEAASALKRSIAACGNSDSDKRESLSRFIERDSLSESVDAFFVFGLRNLLFLLPSVFFLESVSIDLAVFFFVDLESLSIENAASGWSILPSSVTINLPFVGKTAS